MHDESQKEYEYEQQIHTIGIGEPLDIGKLHVIYIAVIVAVNILGLVLLIVDETGQSHANWMSMAEKVVDRIDTTLVPATTIVLVIMEGSIMVLAKIFQNQNELKRIEERKFWMEEGRRQGREEERNNRLETRVNALENELQQHKKGGVTREESDTDQHS